MKASVTAALFFAASAARVPKGPPPESCHADLPFFTEEGARKAAADVLVKALPDYQKGRFKDLEVMKAVDNSTDTMGGEGCAEDSYGEMPVEYANTFFKKVNCRPSDTFADLGSGLGRVVVEAAVLGGMRKAVGVELSVQRHKMACDGLMEATKGLEEIQGKAGTSRVELHQGNLLKFDLKGFTTIFASTICFRDALMEKLGAKLAREVPEGARFAATTDFPASSPPPVRMVRQEPVKAGYDFYLYVYRAQGANATLLQRRPRS